MTMRFDNKKTARSALLAQRMQLDAAFKKEAECELCKIISSLDEFDRCQTLLLYHPTKNEPDLTPLFSIAKEQGKQVAFPISNKCDLTLTFGLVESLFELSEGSYNISEPSQDARTAEINEKTLCIVPALAYDTRGFRLGYGKGYYDRFLKDFSGISLGAVFSAFLADRLPTDKNDIPVDIIITETGAILKNEN